MKTPLKVLLCVVASFVAIRVFPILLLPVVLGAVVTLAVGSVLTGGIAALAASAFALLAGVMAVALVVVAVLSPFWLPVLAVIGLVSLLRRPQPVAPVAA